MRKKTFQILMVLLGLVLFTAMPALCAKSVMVTGGGMEQKVYLSMPKLELITELGAPDRIKSAGHAFSYDVFGMSVLLDDNMRVSRIYLNRDFKGTIFEEGEEAVSLDDTYRLESVTVQTNGQDTEVRVGMTDQEIISALGDPQKIESHGHWLQYDNYDISFLLDADNKVQQIYLGQNFKGVVKGQKGGPATGLPTLYSKYGDAKSTERRTYAPSADLRSHATVELENKFDQEQRHPTDYPWEYRGQHKLYELYGKDMVLKYKYVIDEEGIAFYLDHNQQLYSTVIYPPYPPKKPAAMEAAAARPAEGPAETVCLEMVHFDFDRYNIKSIYIPVLNKWIAYLNQHPDAYVTIEGHTDFKGTDAYNQGLSERRSYAVYNYFVKHGIAPERLKRVGYSEHQPIAPNQYPDGRDDPDGRAINRRVQFKVSRPISAQK